MKKAALLLSTSAAFALTAAPGVAGTAHKCGHINASVGQIRATGVTCKTARRVVRRHEAGRRIAPWKCRYRQYEGGVAWTCRNGKSKKITYARAD